MRKLFLTVPTHNLVRTIICLLAFQIGLSAFFFARVNAQTYTGNLTLNSQAAVDAFAYTEVTGVLTIGGVGSGTITNLDGLSELIHVGYSLLLNRTNVTNLNGLSNLKSTGYLSIDGQINLTNLDGLSGLETINAQLTISNNPVLSNIDGLSNVTQCGGLVVENNDALTNINALSQLTGTFGDLKLEGNQLLQNINGLSNITGIAGDLWVKDNPALDNIDGLGNVQLIGGFVNFINDNALANVDGFSKLAIVNGAFSIVSCYVLANVDGLSKLTTVKRGFGLSTNGSLTNVDGLSSLETVEERFSITSNGHLTNLDGLTKLKKVGENLEITGNRDLVDFCGLTNLFATGTIGGTINISNNGANTVALSLPQDVTVYNDANLCSAVVSSAAIGTATAVGCLKPGTVTHTDFPSGNVFSVGTTQITWSVTDGAGNTATASQNVTVVDNQNPVITGYPADITVSCAADVPVADITSVTATDNCSVVITHVGDVVTNQTCTNRFTLTRTYKATDPSENYVTVSQVITVNDNTAPQIINLAPSQVSLWPPNHTMRDITLNYTATDNCVSTLNPIVTISSNEPVNGMADGDTDPDWEVVDAHHIRLRAERASNGNGRVYTITVTVDDGCNAPVSNSTEVRVAHNITGPLTGKPFKIGSLVDFSGEFWDKPGNKHTAKWLIDGNTSVKGAITEPALTKNGKVTGSYKFGSAGVYKLQMNVTDQAGVTSYANTNGDLEEIIVIYDPNGGYIYGGGWFNSPAGALRSNPTATGKVSYGFALNYFKNATLPKGETQFEFKVGEFEFNAVNFDYLSISGAKAQFKGTGKIVGGQSGINFIATVIDGDIDGTGVDKLRMKIYNKNTGEVYYDNQPGSGDADDPSTKVGANSLITISSNIGNPITTRTPADAQIPAPNSLDVNAFPNPSGSNFTVKVRSTNRNEKINLQVIDAYGRIIETRSVSSSGDIIFGQLYRPGVYYIRVIQGKQFKELKLVKLSD